jgi:isocitrate dehydrogenase
VTLEAGAVTLDVARQTGDVEHATSTSGFADTIIGNLGRQPSARYPTKAGVRSGPVPAPRPRWTYGSSRAIATDVTGVDIYVESDLRPEALGELLGGVAGPDFELELISTRGTLAYPAEGGRMEGVGWWSCRFRLAPGQAYSEAGFAGLLQRVGAKVPWVQVFKLREYGGKEGFTKAQG